MMKKKRQPLSTKKPPIPSENYQIIQEWMKNNVMPKMYPLIKKVDEMIREGVPDLHYSIKWGSAFYGTKLNGWLIEVAAYAVSANIVFLSGADFDPQPPLGTDDRSRYIKLTSIEDLNNPEIGNFIEQAKGINGWK